MATPRIQSVDRAFALLQQLAKPGSASSLPVMAERSGLSVATAHRLLATLESIGAVIRTGSDGYRIGMGLHELTRGSCRDELLVAAVQPVLAKLARTIDLTLHAGVMSSDQMVTYIAKQAPRNSYQVPTRIGSQLEAYCSGIGKVLLASMEEAEQHAYLVDAPFVMLTPNTVTDPQQLKAELAEAKVRGYAIDNCEIYADLRCVAVPIHDADGGIIAALSCSGATDVVTFEAIPGLVSELRTASAAIHAKLFPASSFRLQ